MESSGGTNAPSSLFVVDSAESLDGSSLMNTPRSTESIGGGGTLAQLNRQELIQKIEQLKKKWNYGIQFAYEHNFLIWLRTQYEMTSGVGIYTPNL